MGKELAVRGQGGNLTIQVLAYERPGAVNKDDANWLGCHLEANIGPFTVELAPAFTTHDFVKFLSGLTVAYAQLCGTASFRTAEDSLRLDIRVERSGRA